MILNLAYSHGEVSIFVQASTADPSTAHTARELEERLSWDDIVNGVKNIGNDIKNTATTVGNDIKNAAQTVGNDIKNTATTVGTDVKNAAIAAGNEISNVANTVGNTISNTIKRTFATGVATSSQSSFAHDVIQR